MSDHRPVALVTGASSGIGAVYAERFAARGHDLVLVARRRQRLEELATSLRATHGCKVDVLLADLAADADVARVEAAIGETPGLAVLVNCAGLGSLGLVETVNPADLERMLKVNVLALTRLAGAAARRFGAAAQGAIINIGSIIATMPVAGGGGYSGSKAYVLNFSQALQAELVDKGVKVQVVLPGPVRSEFFGDAPPPFPDELFMTAETLVDTSLAAFDQGEVVTFPSLQELDAWEQFNAARANLARALTSTGRPARRYGPIAS